jgi:hypothetical protein
MTDPTSDGKLYAMPCICGPFELVDGASGAKLGRQGMAGPTREVVVKGTGHHMTDATSSWGSIGERCVVLLGSRLLRWGNESEYTCPHARWGLGAAAPKTFLV